MKLYLVNPLFNPTIWSLDGLKLFTGTCFSTPPLGLATVAALTPKHWDVEIADENVGPIDFDVEADLVGITAFNVQSQRAFAIASEFRKRGKRVVFGGPYCTLFPEAFEDRGDYRVCGEAELIWPEFLRDFENGCARELYSAAHEKANLHTTPVPRFDLVPMEKYNMACLQTSRGCPFQCEFCDIVIMDGRIPRTKKIEQVIAEVNHCRKQGARNILFGDANFIGNISYARSLLKALAQYSKENGYPVEFSCELTLNVAQHDDILELLQAANFHSLYIGIESPRSASLVETNKMQNTGRNVLESVKKIQSYHISVAGGMIVGFDSDDRLIFKEQYDFLQKLGIPFTTCGTLVALPNTPLLKRLQSEGRMLSLDWSNVNGHGSADCNFVPKQMTQEDLNQGHNWLLRCLYSYDSYGDRLVTLLSRFRNRNKEHKRTDFDRKFIAIVFEIVSYYLFTFDKARIRFFARTFWRAARSGPFSFGKWLEFFRWMATYRSFRKYIIETQGIPEEVDPDQPPFSTTAEVFEEQLVEQA